MADARPKKPASDRRKLQNRIAQKGYRERQKTRMQALERLLDSQNHHPVDLVLNDLTSTASSTETGLASQATGSYSTSPSFVSASSSRTGDPVVSGAIQTGELQIEKNAGSLIQAHSVDTPDLPLRERIFNQLMQEIDNIDEAMYSQIVSGEIPVSQIFRAGLRHISTRSAQNQLSNEAFLTDEPNPPLRTNRILVPENRMRVHAHALPNIYANNLRLKQFTTISALRASVESLGLTFDMLSDPDTESPFYRGSLSKDAAEIIIAKERFNDVVPHLRPTIAQIRHRHHPYLDALPFPTLRERIIEACSLESPILDEEELCDDLEKGGLICWGSSLGGENLATGSGAPWDYRSWEAQPWFLRKWWFFIGGSKGELFQQTRWWHEMRGDRLVAPCDVLIIDHVLNHRLIRSTFFMLYAINIADVSTGSTPAYQPINRLGLLAGPTAQRSNAHIIKNTSQSIPTLAGIIDQADIYIKADMVLIKGKRSSGQKIKIISFFTELFPSYIDSK